MTATITKNTTRQKPKIYHIIKTGVNEKGEFGKEQRLIIKTADSIFNSPSNAKTFSSRKRRK